MQPLDSDGVLLLLFASTVAVVSLLLLLQVYTLCFLKRAASQGHLPTSTGPLVSARDAAVAAAMADGAGPDQDVEAEATRATLPVGSCAWGGDVEAGDCVVCLSGLGEDGGGGGVRVLPRCRHAFHEGCIGRWWLVSHSACCPICRTPARPAPAAPSAAVATSPPLPPLMAAPVRSDEEAAAVLGGAVGGHLAAGGVVFLGEQHQVVEELHLPLLLLY